MINPTPQKEHMWLERLVGEWTSESQSIETPDMPAAKHSGTETVRSLDGIWYIAEGRGDMGPTMMTLGFDPEKKKYVGIFVGSMMTDIWLYEGELDADEKVLTLDTVGPSFTGDGSKVPYKDSIEFLSDDRRTLTSKMQGTDGQWTEFMRADYRRVR